MSDFWHYLTLGYLWGGAVVTLELAVSSFLASIALGAVLAECRLTRFWPVRTLASTYIYIIRGTPLLLQMVIVFDALPSIGITLSPFTAAFVSLTISEAAFFAEILRGGVKAVDRNNLLAAQALGMTPAVTRRRVVWPLALRAIIPSLGNEFINLIKSTSLVSVISVPDLSSVRPTCPRSRFVFFPVFLAAGLMYLALTTGVSALQVLWERHVSLERRTNLELVRTIRHADRTQQLPSHTGSPSAQARPSAAG